MMLRGLIVIVGGGSVLCGFSCQGLACGSCVEPIFSEIAGVFGRMGTEVLVVSLDFFSIPDRACCMFMRCRSQVRGVGEILPDLIMVGGLAMIMRCLSVMICGGRMVSGPSALFAHLSPGMVPAADHWKSLLEVPKLPRRRKLPPYGWLSCASLAAKSRLTGFGPGEGRL